MENQINAHQHPKQAHGSAMKKRKVPRFGRRWLRCATPCALPAFAFTQNAQQFHEHHTTNSSKTRNNGNSKKARKTKTREQVGKAAGTHRGARPGVDAAALQQVLHHGQTAIVRRLEQRHDALLRSRNRKHNMNWAWFEKSLKRSSGADTDQQRTLDSPIAQGIPQSSLLR